MEVEEEEEKESSRYHGREDTFSIDSRYFSPARRHYGAGSFGPEKTLGNDGEGGHQENQIEESRR